jgi:hypothetical protein
MSDPATENTDSAPENTDSVPDNTDNTKSNAFQAFLLKAWNAIMIVCTTILSFYVFILKDSSASPYVALGIIGLCMPPAVDMVRTAKRNRELEIKYEEQRQKAAMARRKQEREKEKKAQERERIMAANEFAERCALRNLNAQDVNAQIVRD